MTPWFPHHNVGCIDPLSKCIKARFGAQFVLLYKDSQWPGALKYTLRRDHPIQLNKSAGDFHL